jgi:hypothetical protein
MTRKINRHRDSIFHNVVSRLYLELAGPSMNEQEGVDALVENLFSSKR